MPDEDVTRLLDACSRGDDRARERLFELVYGELRAIARRRPGVGRPGETLQPTALVNEASIQIMRRMTNVRDSGASSRREFFTIMALAMRGVLKDHWRGRAALKRGGGRRQIGLGDGAAEPPTPHTDDFDDLDYLALDGAVERLRLYNERWYDVVMHRFFAGRSIEETAELLEMGVTAVKRDWRFARAWLLREVRGADSGS